MSHLIPQFFDIQNRKKYGRLGMIFALMLSGCSHPVTLIQLSDDTQSAKENATFKAALLVACKTLAQNSRPKDRHAFILVNGTMPNVADLKPVRIPEELHRPCQAWQNSPPGEGATEPCQSWTVAHELIEREDLPPLVVSAIENNDAQTWCPETLNALSSTIQTQNGMLLLIGAENKANNPFSQLQWDLLHNHSHVRFCAGDGSDVADCVRSALKKVRRNAQEIQS